MVREALGLLEPTDATLLLVDAQRDLGEVLAAAGRLDAAREGVRGGPRARRG